MFGKVMAAIFGAIGSARSLFVEREEVVNVEVAGDKLITELADPVPTLGGVQEAPLCERPAALANPVRTIRDVQRDGGRLDTSRLSFILAGGQKFQNIRISGLHPVNLPMHVP
jgi:hypothetical protein